MFFPLFVGQPLFIIVFLVSEDFHELRREFTDLLTKFVISVEGVLGSELPIAVFFKLFDFLFILVLIVIIELGSKNGEPSDFQTIEDLGENDLIIVIVIYHRINCNEVIFTDVLFGDLILTLPKDESAKCMIAILLLGLLKKVLTAVDSLYIQESRFFEVLADVALSTTNVEDLCFDSVFRAQLTHQLCANHGRKACFNELLLIGGRNAVIILLKSVLRENAQHLFLLDFLILFIPSGWALFLFCLDLITLVIVRFSHRIRIASQLRLSL